MKLKTQFLFAFCIAVLLTLTSINTAYPWGEVKKAKDFMAAGMYPQAIELLNKRISDKPTDTEAHYQLGICYINTGNYSGADERFGSAVRLKSEYGYKIGGDYKKAGSESLSKGQTGQAQTLFRKAVQYQPDLQNEIAGECKDAGSTALNRGNVMQAEVLFMQAVQYQPTLKVTISQEALSQGKSFFNSGQYDDADSRFRVAKAFDSSLNQKISGMYFELGNKAGESDCIGFYNRAAGYGSKHNKEIGNRYLAISKTKAKEDEIQKWRRKASKFIEVPPDYKVYNPGNYTLPSLKAGERTKKWIVIPTDRRVWCNLTSHDNKFIFEFSDGTKYKKWKVKKIPYKTSLKFKILAVSDQPGIKMEVGY